MIRGRTVLVLLAAGVIAACASSGSKPSGGGSGGSIGSDAGGAAGNGGAPGTGGSAATGGTTPDATPPDAGGDTGTDTGTPDANPPDATQQDASPDTGSDASTCGATSQQCGTSIACAPGDKCHALYTGPGVRDWPVGTDATGPVGDGGGTTCTDSKGIHWPSEGVGSATWFGFIDCGSYKIFPVTKGCAFDVLSYNDCCSGCFLNDVQINVQEMVNGVWTTQKTISHPYQGVCDHWDDIYVPKTSQVRLEYAGSGGSYVCVFQQ